MRTTARHAVRMMLPRWDPGVRMRLEEASIAIVREPERPLINEPVDVTLELCAADERDARLQVGRALSGWVMIAPQDFIVVAAF